MTHASNQLGRIGEDLAVRHLQAQGYAVVARNWRCAEAEVRGEIDVIAEQDGTLVFCEVKARRRRVVDDAFAAVTWSKQRQLRHLAALYLGRARSCTDVRFDVIAVTWPPGGGGVVIDHIPGAF